MPDPSIDPGRRRFLFGRCPDASSLRPPWMKLDAMAGVCTRCGICRDACPEAILVAGDGGFPAVEFGRGECSFCGACAAACPEPLFDRTLPPWDLAVTIAPSCLAGHGIICRSCRDACPQSAVHFAPAPDGIARPDIDALACTGCGACVPACPAGAVTLRYANGTGHGG